MGIVFSAFFSLGITLITILKKDNKIDINHFLFCSILGVTAEEVRDTDIIAAVVLLVVVLLYKELLFYTFDLSLTGRRLETNQKPGFFKKPGF